MSAWASGLCWPLVSPGALRAPGKLSELPYRASNAAVIPPTGARAHELVKIMRKDVNWAVSLPQSHRLTEAQQSLQTLGPFLQFTEEGAAVQKGEVAIRL